MHWDAAVRPGQLAPSRSHHSPQAREEARAAILSMQRGVDPKAEAAKRRREEERRRADTFGAVFDAFTEDHLADLRTGTVVAGVIRKHVVPAWGDRPIGEIRRADVNELVRGLRRSTPVGANRVLAYLKKCFGWAADQEIIEASPATAVKRPSKENPRDRVLTDSEIRAIWRACGQLGAFGRAFRLNACHGPAADRGRQSGLV